MLLVTQEIHIIPGTVFVPCVASFKVSDNFVTATPGLSFCSETCTVLGTGSASLFEQFICIFILFSSLLNLKHLKLL